MRALALLAILVAACGDDAGTTPEPDAPVIPMPGTFTVTGVVRYEDRPPLDNGSLGPIAPKVARGVAISVISEATSMALATGVVGDDGTFSLTFDALGGESVHLLAATFSDAPARPITVARRNKMVHGFGGATFGAGLVSTQAVLVTVASKSAQAFNVFDELVVTMDAVHTLLKNPTPTPLTAVWQDGSDDGTYYWEREIYLLGEAADDDGFDDTVIHHEAGHYIEDVEGRSDSEGGGHDGSPTDPRLAWSEGFATYWALAVRAHPIYCDSNADGGWSYNADTTNTVAEPTGMQDQLVSEDMVSEILWDLGDSGTTDDDTLPGTHGAVLLVQPEYLRTATLRVIGTVGVDLVDLLDGFFVAGGLTGCAEVRAIVQARHHFPYDFAGPAGSCPP